MDRLRVAYTLEQCWGRVPGGTAVAALEVARELASMPGIELIGVSGTHAAPPPEAWNPSMPMCSTAGHGARLYAQWVFLGRPTVERVTGPLDIAHSTSLIPCPAEAPVVVTVHDLAFLHVPDAFTRWGRTLFHGSVRAIRRRAGIVLCASTATMNDCERAGIPADRLRLVPLGVRAVELSTLATAVDTARQLHALPERFVLFVGTIEPRKNLARLIAAMALLEDPLPLVVAGAPGWGEAVSALDGVDVQFLGFVPPSQLQGLYAAAAVFCYPSLWEGFGLPVLEAMASGTPVVTSADISTAEVAAGAAVLVDPRSSTDIARGLTEALGRTPELVVAGRIRAAEMTWTKTAALTVDAYRELAG